MYKQQQVRIASRIQSGGGGVDITKGMIGTRRRRRRDFLFPHFFFFFIQSTVEKRITKEEKTGSRRAEGRQLKCVVSSEKQFPVCVCVGSQEKQADDDDDDDDDDESFV